MKPDVLIYACPHSDSASSNWKTCCTQALRQMEPSGFGKSNSDPHRHIQNELNVGSATKGLWDLNE